MLKFEKAINRALMDLKNWVLRKRPSAEIYGNVGKRSEDTLSEFGVHSQSPSS